MIKFNASNLNFFSGILFAIASITYFSSNNKVQGIIFICLSFTFIAQGSIQKKKEK
ncbi:hypothetical protein LGL08_10040 [Clostridium estertheticum]|uniref:hypothetical protein n=1 Tax=Clostridium estertheticum TaxID=238834 RepID=UPI001CF30AD9|nr:hypothetical protein [Clostridium estertheticum]MCB2307296.1 hypothetical protein [Clostridium estertheticum]MCB2344946.1 hypothetical protein [Clostridium estertheticum]MCB2349892.1 hypothetical protein [Clostridium estertheticum]WAG48185.1 hypothetical protein LL127_21260 [Clostridium estertheticum]